MLTAFLTSMLPDGSKPNAFTCSSQGSLQMEKHLRKRSHGREDK